MKIVFIAIKGIDKIGGIETYTRELGQRLVKNGHEVIVYTLKDETHQEQYTYKGMLIIPLPAINKSVLAKLSLVLLASFHQFKHRNVDVIHYHAIGPSMFCFIPRIMGRNTVVQSHGHEWKWTRSSFKQFEIRFFNFAEKVAFFCSNKITAVSKELKQDYEGKHNRHVQYIPNGINHVKPLPANLIKKTGARENNYILFLGRISREKGIHHLISAYQRLDTSMQLVIVGQQREGDTYLSELKALANNNPHILFPGVATGELWNEWYSNAAISVLPSETEGLPIALLEAMSFGNCCITSDIPPNKEALSNAGITFESKNVDSLVNALKQLINNPEKRESLGSAAKQRVYNEYTWKRVTTEIERFYLESIISKYKQHQPSLQTVREVSENQ